MNNQMRPFNQVVEAMTNDILRQVTKYNALVIQYHALDDAIDALLMEYEGYSENMSESAMVRYRILAQERDDIFNAMRAMEQDLFPEDVD